MKVIKKINNNVALCLDNNNHELIAFGNGIGFPRMPYELTDLSKVSRTFYGVDASFISMMETLDEGVLKVCIQIVDHAKMALDSGLTANVVFTPVSYTHLDVYKRQGLQKILFMGVKKPGMAVGEMMDMI